MFEPTADIRRWPLAILSLNLTQLLSPQTTLHFGYSSNSRLPMDPYSLMHSFVLNQAILSDYHVAPPHSGICSAAFSFSTCLVTMENQPYSWSKCHINEQPRPTCDRFELLRYSGALTLSNQLWRQASASWWVIWREHLVFCTDQFLKRTFPRRILHFFRLCFSVWCFPTISAFVICQSSTFRDNSMFALFLQSWNGIFQGLHGTSHFQQIFVLFLHFLFPQSCCF